MGIWIRWRRYLGADVVVEGVPAPGLGCPLVTIEGDGPPRNRCARWCWRCRIVFCFLLLLRSASVRAGGGYCSIRIGVMGLLAMKPVKHFRAVRQRAFARQCGSDKKIINLILRKTFQYNALGRMKSQWNMIEAYFDGSISIILTGPLPAQ